MLQGKLTTESTLTGSLDCGFVEPTLMEKNITSNGTYNASADNVDGYSKVNVDVQSSGGIPYIDLDGNLQHINESLLVGVGACYKEYSLTNKTWNYYSGSGYEQPCFRITKSSSFVGSNASCYLAGYTSKKNFWQTAGNDKCVAVGSNYINISDDSFNGDTTAFKNFMNGKKIILLYTSSTLIE